jgi:hypothetical protein
MRAIDLHRQQVIAAHAHGPGAVELADHIAFALKGGVAGVVAGAGVGFAAFVEAFRQVRGSEAAHGLHFAKEIVDHIAPVAEHIDDDAAAVFLAVVP